MICRYCGIEIKRCIEDDSHVQGWGSNKDLPPGYPFVNRVAEAWTDGSFLACGDRFDTRTWHEPLSTEEAIASLQMIEADLR